MGDKNPKNQHKQAEQKKHKEEEEQKRKQEELKKRKTENSGNPENKFHKDQDQKKSA